MSRELDHNVWLEWLYIEADGGLNRSERSQLQQHLVSCDRCQAERERLPELFGLLASDRMEPREGFAQEVMSALPAAGWEARSPRSWKVALAMLAGLIVAAAFLVNSGTGAVPGAGALVAIAELFRSTITAGAGLLGASWQGLGMAVGEIVDGSPVQAAVFAIFVLGVNVLFVRALLRAWRPRAAAAKSSRTADRGE